jgi:hypothetical protein
MNSIPEQLIQMGYFACAPVYPTLAVHMDMLKFISILFVHAAPNERAWAATLTKYLHDRGHEFATGDSLRRRFASALAQYQVLMLLVMAEMDKIIYSRGVPPGETVALDDTTPVRLREYTSAQGSTILGQVPDPSVDSSPSASTPQLRPGDYLRRACPLCFGGHDTDAGEDVNIIVCLDANFQLKRNRDRDRRPEFKDQVGSLDPNVTSPHTVFLSESQIREWEERVEVVRPSRPKAGDKRKAKEMETTEVDLLSGGKADEIEPGMTLPNATYDACRDSFIAADGDRIKASSTFFDSTGVMAMLCHHDRPLLLANLKTAGEKQFYAFALISTLMSSLPSHWKVGILYDIGCQLHRTLRKWDLMPEFLHRLQFAVSIFHAYGHQWACQLWYHPRKAEIWGLSDGEGCERFWSELRKLIPGLRVTGVRCMISQSILLRC